MLSKHKRRGGAYMVQQPYSSSALLVATVLLANRGCVPLTYSHAGASLSLVMY